MKLRIPDRVKIALRSSQAHSQRRNRAHDRAPETPNCRRCWMRYTRHPPVQINVAIGTPDALQSTSPYDQPDHTTFRQHDSGDDGSGGHAWRSSGLHAPVPGANTNAQLTTSYARAMLHRVAERARRPTPLARCCHLDVTKSPNGSNRRTLLNASRRYIHRLFPVFILRCGRYTANALTIGIGKAFMNFIFMVKIPIS